MSYFLGIYREPEFSPGRHTSNDALILRLVGQALEQSGAEVKLVSLEEARGLWRDASLVFSMCQGPQALAELSEWKAQGAQMVNDPAASLRTYREALCHSLARQALPFPRSAVLPTEGSAKLATYESFFTAAGAWLKRADVHATQPADVVRVKSFADLARALEKFHARQLPQAVLQQHLEGDEVKFYGVRGKFFWPYYPKDCVGHPFDETVLQKTAEETAGLLQINVYGGDAIIAPSGTITLIDFNDWPSFAPCRGAAAHAIARFLKESYVPENRRETSNV